MPIEELNKVLLAEIRRGRQTYLECLISLGAQITSPVKQPTKNLVTGVPYTKCYSYLHVAAHNGDVSMLEKLLYYGEDPYFGSKDITVVANSDLSGGDGRLPLDIAAQMGHIEIVRALVKWAEEIPEDIEVSPPASPSNNPPPSISSSSSSSQLLPFPPGFVDSIMRLGRKVDNHRTLLFALIEEGSVELMQGLVRMGAVLDAVQQGGLQPVQYAVSLGKVEMVRELVRLGATMGTCRESWNTCYHIAVELGLVDVLKEIAEHDPDSVNVANRVGDLPLHVAARKGNVEVMKVLLDCGAASACLENMAYGGNTALHCAVGFGNLDVIRVLVERGANAKEINRDYETPLLLATRKNHTSTALYLIEKASETISRVDQHGATPLHYAARHGNLELVKEFVGQKAEVDSQANDWYTPLLFAAHSGHTEVVRFLLEHKAGIELKTKYDHRTPLIEAVTQEKIDTVALLLDSGANVNVRDCHTGSALYYAVMKGNMCITKMLLDHGATIVEGDHNLLAIAVEHGVEMMKLLLKYNAKPNSQALVVAIEKKKEDEAILLLDEGASCYIEDYIATPSLHLAICHGVVSVAKKLIAKGEVVKPEALHLAVHANEPGMVSLVLERVKAVEDLKGFDLTLPSEYKRLFGSCRCGGCTSIHCSVDLGSRKITQLLVEKGFNINTKNSKGETPLHVALRLRKVDTAQYLIECGASLGWPDLFGMTPLHCALLPYQSGPVLAPDAPPPPPLISLASIVKQLISRGIDPDAKLPLAYPIPNSPQLLFPIPPSPDFLPPSSISRTGISPATFTGTPLEHALWNRWTTCHSVVLDWDGLWELLGGDEKHKAVSKASRSANGDTLLHQAVMMLDTKAVELLVKAGFDVNAVNSAGKTPLVLAEDFVARCQESKYLVDLVNSEVDKIKLLLSKQAVMFHCEWPTVIFTRSMPFIAQTAVPSIASRPKVTVRKRKI